MCNLINFITETLYEYDTCAQHADTCRQSRMAQCTCVRAYNAMCSQMLVRHAESRVTEGKQKRHAHTLQTFFAISSVYYALKI